MMRYNMEFKLADPEDLGHEIEETRNNLSTDRLDMSFGEIISMYERNEVIIDPDFQRLFRWSEYQQSRFIESILLGIPIPPIFVAEDKKGRWELVDGLQRLSAVLSFFGVLKTLPERNNWTLQEGDIIRTLENYSCKDLPLKFQLNIKRSTCRIEIIRWNSQYDMRFELFNRLNTGGSPLTSQEIRNCIYRGISSDFNEFLKKLADNPEFDRLISPTRKQREELYLEELVLRFASLYRNLSNVKSSIDQHMTYFMKNAVEDSNFSYNIIEDIFLKTVSVLKPLGSEIFCSPQKHFATGLYDMIMIGMAEHIGKYSNISHQKIMRKINEEIKADKEIKRLSGRGADSRNRIIYRLEMADKIFSKV